jgi:hypothetical protein
MNNSNATAVYVPHSIEAEQALLGAILVNSEAFERAEPHVSSADFFEPIHAHLFERFAAARKDGSAITIHLAVAWLGELESMDVAGMTSPAWRRKPPPLLMLATMQGRFANTPDSAN